MGRVVTTSLDENDEADGPYGSIWGSATSSIQQPFFTDH